MSVVPLRSPAPEPTEPTLPERLLTTEDLAELFRVTPNVIRQMKHAGQLPPPYRLGGRRLRWSPADIAAWLDAHREDQ